MADASTGPIPLNGYHAHVYYDAATRPVDATATLAPVELAPM